MRDCRCKRAAEELGISQYSIYEWKKKFFPLAALPGCRGLTPIFGHPERITRDGSKVTFSEGFYNRLPLVRPTKKSRRCFPLAMASPTLNLPTRDSRSSPIRTA
jgi:hypothetical protein